MKKVSKYLFVLILFAFACNQPTETATAIEKCGKHYQQHKDYKSLNCVVDLLAPKADTLYVQSLLGEPIDMGFDYRYLVDSTGAKGCAVGAVFHIDEGGKIDQKWLGEICE